MPTTNGTRVPALAFSHHRRSGRRRKGLNPAAPRATKRGGYNRVGGKIEVSTDIFARIAGLWKKNAVSTLIISGSSIYIIIVSFLRGVIVARMFGPEEFGFAVIIITISAGMDLLCDGAVDQYVVRSRFGHRKDVLAVAQGWRLASTLIASIPLVIFAAPIANAVGAAELAGAIAALIVPAILRGFSTLEIKAQQRQHRFDHEAKIDVLRTTAELITLLGAALLLPSHWAVVAGLTANAAVQFVASAVLCGRLPRLSFRPRLRRLIARFSIPVTLNAMILFAATQGDRFIIASAFNAGTLALYAAACALGQAVATLLSRIIGRLFLPHFGASTVGHAQKRHQADNLSMLFLIGSFAVAVTLTLAVPPIVPLIYGPAFRDVHHIVAASAALQMLQIEQAWLTTLMVGAGATARFPVITGARALALPLVLPLLWKTGDILLVPIALTAGAAVSLLISYTTLVGIDVLSRRTAMIGMARAVVTVGALCYLLL